MANTETTWPAPAKINLFLHILGRRKDGYHVLQTAFQFLDYGDELGFLPRDDGQILPRYVLTGVTESQDIIIRAAHLLRQTANIRQGVEIELIKRLPMGGGLGGGSSDAATTLHALNQIWDCNLPFQQLEKLGLQLGADVPVFVRGLACWAEGVGERLSPIEPVEPWYLIIKPPVSVATAEIFAASELTRNSQPITIRDLLEGKTRNDCEPVVRMRYPQVANALNWLSGYTRVYMSGTGACIFGAFERRDQAENVLRALDVQQKNGAMFIGEGFIAKGLNQSPLIKRLRNII